MHAHVLAYYQTLLIGAYEAEAQLRDEFRTLTHVVADKKSLGSQESMDEQLTKWFEMNRELASVVQNKFRLILKIDDRVQRLRHLDDFRTFETVCQQELKPLHTL